MKCLALIVLALMATSVRAAITTGATVTCDATGTACVAPSPITVNTGDTIVVTIKVVGAPTISTTDNCGNTFVSKYGTTQVTEIQIASPAIAGSCTITVHRTTSNQVTFIAQVYSGVGNVASAAVNANATISGSGASTGCFGSLATTVTGDTYAGLIWFPNTSVTFTGANGLVIRNQQIQSGQGKVGLGDLAAATAGPTAVGVTTGLGASGCTILMLDLSPQVVAANYYGTPPLVAGANISIARSATALTISASGTGGATVVAFGQATLQAFTFPAGSCNPTILTVAATGVQSTDVVNWSYGGGVVPGGNWVEVIHTGAYATAGNVNFKSCNSRNDAAQATTAQTINWQVVR